MAEAAALLRERLAERVNADRALVRRGRRVQLSFLLGIDSSDFLIRIAAGEVTEVAPRRLATQSGVFTVRAAGHTWLEHWQPLPRRDYHDLWSMLPKGLARIDGDLLPLMQHLQYFKDVMAAPRHLAD